MKLRNQLRSIDEMANELFYMKNVGLLFHRSAELSPETVQAMELSGMHLGEGAYMTILYSYPDINATAEGPEPGALSVLLGACMEETFFGKFIHHGCELDGIRVSLLCFPYAKTESPPDQVQIETACQQIWSSFTRRTQGQPLQLLCSPVFWGYQNISREYDRLRHCLQYRRFVGAPPAVTILDPLEVRRPYNLQYRDALQMKAIAVELAAAIDAGRLEDMAQLEQKLFGKLFSEDTISLKMVHSKLFAFLSALLAELERLGVVDQRYIERTDFFWPLTETASYPAFCQVLDQLLEDIVQFSAHRLDGGDFQFQRIVQVREYVDAHVLEPSTTVCAVAARFGMSQPMLSASFKRHFGVNLLTYLNRRRLETVKELLLQTQLSQQEIAVSCGFTNATTMQRVFRREEGCAPGQWRTRHCCKPQQTG